jgi:hypothetical protein
MTRRAGIPRERVRDAPHPTATEPEVAAPLIPRGDWIIFLLISHRWVCPDIVLFSYIYFIKKEFVHKKETKVAGAFFAFPTSDIILVGAFSSPVSLLSFVLNYAM